jgi:hypothetical protein
MEKTDCFAYKVRECTVLTKKLCKNGGDCPFYKTKEQYDSDRIKYEKIAAARKHREVT